MGMSDLMSFVSLITKKRDYGRNKFVYRPPQPPKKTQNTPSDPKVPETDIYGY